MVSEPAAPAVVAVLVACDPGPWWEESLSSLAAQDYDNFSVVVVDVGVGPGLADRVTKALPEARLVRLAPGTGFAEAANRGMELVGGVAHALVCHDDVALAPGALRVLVEEAYRRNGGLTCPKFVLWDAPERLQSVGMGADRLGVTHPLVEPGELDQGQHDAAREVFMAPSGAVLVRTDLWRALGGFDEPMGSPGEDLDLCWRAQLAGARVVVAPHAHARHLQAADHGMRPAVAGRAERRETNRLRTLWRCYGLLALVVVAPVVVAFAVAESLWALVHNGARGALAPLRALVGSVRQPRALWQGRRQVQSLRRSRDTVIWKAQSRGSARLRQMFRRRLERGHQLAWAAAKAAAAPGPSTQVFGPQVRRAEVLGPQVLGPEVLGPEALGAEVLGAGVLGPEVVGAPGPGDQPEAIFARSDWRVTAATGTIVLAIVLIGCRHVLTQSLPLTGQMPSTVGGVSGWWHAWWSGSGTAGLGSKGPAIPGLLVMGVVGLVSLGSANTAIHIMVLGPLLLGPVGVYLESRPLGPHRGRLAATVLYAALPVPYNAISQGHWAGLVSYAAAPWFIGELCRLSRQAPYRAGLGPRPWARFVALGLFVAIAASLAPSILLVVALVGLALYGGSALSGWARGAWASAAIAALVAAIGFVALLPWSAGFFGSWDLLVSPRAATHALSVAQLLRFHTGAYGGSVLDWAVVVAAAVSLFIGRSWRLAWSARLWVLALVCLVVAWAGARGWLAVPQLELVLAPAGAALAFATALGGASVEKDLSGYRFGWRQVVPGLGAVAVLAAALPLLGWAGNGQWDLPSSGAEAAFAFPLAAPAGDYRVLWVGAPGSLPLAAQGRADGLAFATSQDGLPAAPQLWAPTGAGEAPQVATALGSALDDQTTGLGLLVSTLAVRYIVVPSSAATARLVDALGRQLDLEPVGTASSYQVFYNTAWVPTFSVLGPGAAPPAAATGAATGGLGPAPGTPSARLRVAQPLVVGNGGRATFSVVTGVEGRAIYGSVPSGSWKVTVDGRPAPEQRAFGWASSWALPAGASPQVVVVSVTGTTGQHLVDIVVLLLWAAGLVCATAGLRSRWRAQLARASLGLGLPGAEVPAIDWPEEMEDETVG